MSEDRLRGQIPACPSIKYTVFIWLLATFVSGKGRLYPAYSLSGSEGEDNSPSLRGRTSAYPQNNHQASQSHLNHYNASQHKQRVYQQQQQQQHPLYHMPGSGAGLSDTPTSGNASDETLTDSDLITIARDSALLVHNDGGYRHAGLSEMTYRSKGVYHSSARLAHPAPPSVDVPPGNQLGTDKSVLNEVDTCE
ncbi:hypothetical protein KM043_016125 [Ampulex compressa]|nr:hypothetical protein KM043_016125 [Ampulex compressa]